MLPVDDDNVIVIVVFGFAVLHDAGYSALAREVRSVGRVGIEHDDETVVVVSVSIIDVTMGVWAVPVRAEGR
jgi:hypothetical protein